MKNTLAIRREDKNKWEQRTPLTPTQLAELQNTGISVQVQSSPIRAFADEDYITAGSVVQDDVSEADIILAIKEIPVELLQPSKTYLFFSHTIKGQAYNMPLLQGLLDLNCQLIDYERIVNEQDRRLIFFGEHAGLAGMIDTLHVMGQRLLWEGYETPLTAIKPTYEYGDLPTAKQALQQVGQNILEQGFPLRLTPFVIGIAGYGNVSRGAQIILNLLPTQQITPQDLLELQDSDQIDRNIIYKVIFREEDTVEPIVANTAFDLGEFFQHPEKYQSQFEQFLPHLSILVNCIYWDTPNPRLLTKVAAQQLFEGPIPPKLRVIGDISCDIEGAIEPTLKAIQPDVPSFVWHPASDAVTDGIEGDGLVIMAVDNLPCELPIEASTTFGEALLPFLPALAACDFSVDFAACDLPPELKRAMIVYHGELTPDYRYLEKFL